jgi:hypothetical protein
MDKHNVLSSSQYGFRKQHSTQHAIHDTVNKIYKNMDNKEITCGIFIDLKKAFDTADHKILLSKLYYYGIRGTQVTTMANVDSNEESCLYGVPQGSVLGPLLFLLYINDICVSTEKLNFYQFADDTSILYSHRNIHTLEQVVNDELHNVCLWLRANKVTLNTEKSNFVIFCNKQKRLNYVPNIQIFDEQTKKTLTLERKDAVKYLGILIDSTLTWKSHIDYISLKISRIIGIITRLRHFVPKHTLLRIYSGLINQYLTYGISVWGQANKSVLNCLLILQKKVIRIMNFANYQDHAIPLFYDFKILPMSFLYFYMLYA